MQDNVLFESGAGETIRRLHLQDFIDCYLLGKPCDERTETERFTAFDYDELVACDNANLNITWLRDPDAEDSDDLQPPEVIAQEVVEALRGRAQ